MWKALLLFAFFAAIALDNLKADLTRKCWPNPCSDNGLCQTCDEQGKHLCDDEEAMHGYHCECKPGYFGRICQNVTNPCLSMPCLNGGFCNLTGKEFEYRCECSTGYNGTHCENMYSICDAKGSLVCEYGHCAEDLNLARGFRCLCDEGYIGFDCLFIEENTNTWSGFFRYRYYIAYPLILGPFIVLCQAGILYFKNKLWAKNVEESGEAEHQHLTEGD